MEFKGVQKQPIQTSTSTSTSVKPNTTFQPKPPTVVNANDFWGNAFPTSQKK